MANSKSGHAGGWTGPVRAALAMVALIAGCGDDSAPEGNEGIKEGQALGKFCHQFNRSGHSIDLTLEFGQPAVAKVTASSGACAPAIGMPCASLPVGSFPARLMEGNKVLATGHFTLQKGGQYVFEAVVSPSTGNPTVRTSPVLAPQMCETVDLIGRDAGPGDGGGDAAVDSAPVAAVDAGAADAVDAPDAGVAAADAADPGLDGSAAALD
jgi:hypothetical protein